MRTLPALQHLGLYVAEGSLAEGFPVGIAASCGQLRELHICGGFDNVELGVLPPELGRLTALTRLKLMSLGVASLPSSISRLTGQAPGSRETQDFKTLQNFEHFPMCTRPGLNIFSC